MTLRNANINIISSVVGHKPNERVREREGMKWDTEREGHREDKRKNFMFATDDEPQGISMSIMYGCGILKWYVWKICLILMNSFEWFHSFSILLEFVLCFFHFCRDTQTEQDKVNKIVAGISGLTHKNRLLAELVPKKIWCIWKCTHKFDRYFYLKYHRRITLAVFPPFFLSPSLVRHIVQSEEVDLFRELESEARKRRDKKKFGIYDHPQ